MSDPRARKEDQAGDRVGMFDFQAARLAKIDKPADEIPFPTSRIRSFSPSLEIAEQIARAADAALLPGGEAQCRLGTVGLISLLDRIPAGFMSLKDVIGRENQRKNHEQAGNSQADCKAFQTSSRGQLLIDTLLFLCREKLVLFDRRATRIDKRLDVFPVAKLASFIAGKPVFGIVQ